MSTTLLFNAPRQGIDGKGTPPFHSIRGERFAFKTPKGADPPTTRVPKTTIQCLCHKLAARVFKTFGWGSSRPGWGGAAGSDGFLKKTRMKWQNRTPRKGGVHVWPESSKIHYRIEPNKVKESPDLESSGNTSRTDPEQSRGSSREAPVELRDRGPGTPFLAHLSYGLRLLRRPVLRV